MYERSTENGAFPMKTFRKTEGTIPPQIFGKRRAGDPSPTNRKLRKGTYLSILGGQLRDKSTKGTYLRIMLMIR